MKQPHPCNLANLNLVEADNGYSLADRVYSFDAKVCGFQTTFSIFLLLSYSGIRKPRRLTKSFGGKQD